MPNVRNGKILDSQISIEYEDEEKIKVKIVYQISEEVGYFRERN